jgi:hypothetical protein
MMVIIMYCAVERKQDQMYHVRVIAEARVK